jgi:hypothetical protein
LAEECCEIAVQANRSFTNEEIDAVKWKLKMHRSSVPSIVKLMTGLSDKTLSSVVVEHKSVVAEPPAPTSKKIPPSRQYILSRDMPWPVKRTAICCFFDWCLETHGMDVVDTMRREKKIPRGLFAGFVQCNPVLKHHCMEAGIFSTNNQRYNNTVRRYISALEFYCKEHPVVLDGISPSSRSAPLSLTQGTTESSLVAVSSSVVAEAGGLALVPWARHTLPPEKMVCSTTHINPGLYV